MKKAFITGVTGQDGSYLTEFLLKKGYFVYGLQRRTSLPNTGRIDHLYDNPKYPNFVTIYGDLTETSSLLRILAKIKPDEIYNLGAQSQVQISFDTPEYTTNVTALGTLRILDAVKQLDLNSRFYQASSSEMFGKVGQNKKQSEKTPFNPQSPYGLSKVFSYYITKIYRDSYNIFASNGILFNHESPRRGINFVTRKITMGLSRIKLGFQNVLKLGNLSSVRDWGYSKDYVEGIWKILNYKTAEDFVLATGKTHTVREFAKVAAKYLDIDLVFTGKNKKEKGIDKKTGKTIISVDEKYYRPLEVDYLCGDYSKAKRLLSWKPKTSFEKLVEIMVRHDYDYLKQTPDRRHKISVQKIITI